MLNLITLLNLFLKKATSSIINLLGLSIGIAACILILLFVKYESSYDKFHEKSKQIYRMRIIDSKNGKVELDGAFASPPMGSSFLHALPEIKNFVRFFNQREVIIEIDERKFEEKNVCYVDSSYFKVFSTQLLTGNSESCLVKPNTAVLSETMAQKYFGNEDPLGKSFKLNSDQLFEITGIYKDMPANSHFHLDILLSYNSPNWLNEGFSNTWDMFFTYTYFLVDVNADIKNLEKGATEIANTNKPESYKSNTWEIRLQPIEDIHLHTDFRGGFEVGGNATMNKILTIAAFIILILAWLNYISMASAQSLDRAKEVGIKKVVGFYKSYLMRTFLIESLILNMVAVFFGLGFVFLTRSGFSELLYVELSFKYWSFGFIGLLIFVFIVGAFLSCLYPAFVMSSFNPIQVLKGKMGISAGKDVGFRKILLSFQFAISTLLIFVTSIIYLQTNFLLNQDLGININNTLVIKGSNLAEGDSILMSNIESFKQSLMKLPEIKSAANSNSIPGNPGFIDGVHSDIQQPEEKHQFRVSYIGYNYLTGFNIKPITGRLFSKDFPSDNQGAIISKSAVSVLGFEKADDAINHKTNRDFGDKNKHIIGVIDDYQISSWKNKSEPMIFYLDSFEKTYFVIKLDRAINQNIISNIENKWREFFSNELFTYFELERSYKELYKNEVRNSKVLGLFAILAIFVACIGLWGLAYFTIANRTKEIGIRKVMGFSAVNIVSLINKDFLKLVFISSIIATPIAWWLGQNWLQNYATKVNLAWWLVLVPFVTISIITVLTISFYTLKLALSNPVEAIGDE